MQITRNGEDLFGLEINFKKEAKKQGIYLKNILGTGQHSIVYELDGNDGFGNPFGTRDNVIKIGRSVEKECAIEHEISIQKTPKGTSYPLTHNLFIELITYCTPITF